MKFNILNTCFRTLILLIVISFLSATVLFSCSGKSNDEDDTFKESTTDRLGLDTTDKPEKKALEHDTIN